MKLRTCHEQPLAEYVDGELSGTERLVVSRHLDVCPDCANAAQSMRRVGDLLRSAASSEPAPAGLAGLAGGVISRTGAERAQSWQAVFGRAFEDWHWFLVGFGSVAAGFFSVAFVSAMLAFGPAPQRQDSLSALLSNRDWQVLNSEDGSLYVWASPMSPTEWRQTRLASSRGNEPFGSASAMTSLTAEGEIVGALGDALGGGGQPLDLDAMPPAVRSLAAAWFDNLKKRMLPSGQAGVYRIQFVTHTEVVAKGL